MRNMQGALWVGGALSAASLLSAAVLAYQASVWERRAAAVREAPGEIAAILSETAFREGHRRWLERLRSPRDRDVTVVSVRGWVNAAAARIPSYRQESLRVVEIPAADTEAGRPELRASLELPEMDTRRLQAFIQELEDRHPGLVCRQLKLAQAKTPHQYDVKSLVFSIVP